MSDIIELHITVDNLGTQGENPTQQNADVANTAVQDATGNTIKWLTVFKSAKQLGKQAGGYFLGNIGLRTGNYLLQEQVNQGLELAGKFAGVAMAFGIGGVAGGVLALAGTAMQTANELYVYNKQREFANIGADLLRQRAGFTAGGNR